MMAAALTSDARLLVTGGSGFMGTNVVEFYRSHGVPLLNVDHSQPRNNAHRSLWTPCDVLDRPNLETIVRSFAPSHVLHLAARTDLRSRKLDDYEGNIAGTANVIHAVNSIPSVSRIVFASSRMVCRIGYVPQGQDDYCPSTAYGASKVECERLIRRSSINAPWTIVRPTSIWGPWFDVPYKDFFSSVARGRYVHPRGHAVQKSFGFVGNSVYQLDRLLVAPAEAVDRQTMYLADYVPLDVRRWAGQIQAAFSAPEVREAPYAALRVAATVGDVFEKLGWRNAPLTRFRLDNLVTNMIYDLAPLQTVAPNLPFSLEAGVAETVAWLQRESSVAPRTGTTNPEAQVEQ